VIQLFKFFLKLGSTGFGGPIAMIGMMEQHFVQNEKSITKEDFQQYVAAAKLFPGPLATLVAMRIGLQLQGKPGAIIAGFFQVFPAFLMILFISHFMLGAKSNSNDIFHHLFLGLNFGGLALSVVAAIRFVKPLINTQSLFYLFGTAVLTYYYPKEEIYFLLACGFLSLIYLRFKNVVFEASTVILSALFFESFKASLFTFGSGLAIVPVLKSIYIDQYHWVTESDFLTALSFGQMTPGPLVILNTYLGNQVGQLPGAVLATTGTFMPTFIFGLWVMPYFQKKLLNNPILKDFFSGMLPAVGGAILGSVLRLCLFAVKDEPGTISLNHTLLLCMIIALALKSKLHPIFILIIGSALTVLGFLAGIIQ